MGRLILPTPTQLQVRDPVGAVTDWVWLELYHAPTEAQDFIGKVIRLEWSPTPELQTYVQTVTTDVQFTEAARDAQREGLVLPQRLDGRAQVGPLQSLAGAHPQDDLLIRLDQVVVVNPAGHPPRLQTAQQPVQVTGRYYGLVQLLGPDPEPPQPAAAQTCVGATLCPPEYYRVRHYNLASGQFDGPQETVRIPQQPQDRDGESLSTPRQIEYLPSGQAGWYIYGAPDQQGVFTVQALKPRSLFQLQPDQTITGQQAGLNYLYHQNWRETPQHQGTTQTVLLRPKVDPVDAATDTWRLGDRALVLHSFGGIQGEPSVGGPPATITGHLSYGLAEVVRDPFTQALQFDIQYQQVYAHNPHGIVAGRLDWAAYAGDLQQGWAGVRPFSDVLIKFESLTEINLGGVRLLPLQALLDQTRVMSARYRTGDGTGMAAVTPATSCVQDSNQALYLAIEQIKRQVTAQPKVFAWLQDYPQDPETQKFEQLVALGDALEALLAPTGVVRSDWQENAKVLAGGDGSRSFCSSAFVVGCSVELAIDAASTGSR